MLVRANISSLARENSTQRSLDSRSMGLSFQRLAGSLRAAGVEVLEIILPDGEQFKEWRTLNTIFDLLLEHPSPTAQRHKLRLIDRRDAIDNTVIDVRLPDPTLHRVPGHPHITGHLSPGQPGRPRDLDHITLETWRELLRHDDILPVGDPPTLETSTKVWADP